MRVLQSYQFACVVLVFSWMKYALSFSVSSSSSDIGVTEDNPARSGQNAQSINLECRLNFNSGEKMTLCKWVHTLPDVWAYDDREAFVMCIAAHESDDGQVCKDDGNIFDENSGGYNDPALNPYTAYDSTRLIQRMNSQGNICGLTIMNPHANDTGIWKCHVNDNNPDVGTQWAEVDLYVANKSVVSITDPELFGNGGLSLEVDLSSSTKVEVDAECTAEFGIPAPDIIWYIDEPSNTVDGSSDQSLQSDGSIVSSIRLSLDQSSMSRYGIRETNNYFSFALGCYPDQGDYFDYTSQDGVNNPAEVLVFGTSGAHIASSSFFILAAVSLLLSQL